jgi:predicted dienelactone hydrolase
MPGRDAMASDDGGPVGDCSPANRAACAYRPAARYGASESAVLTQLSYTDVTGGSRMIEVGVRRPIGAPQPWPVVVWSHGGSQGLPSARNAGDEWSRVFNEAGYLVVVVAHTPRNDAQLAAICMHYGITTPPECARFKFLHHDRPYDVRRALDWIEEQARGPMAGEVDATRILHAGHSAGSGGGSMLAGASRNFNGMSRTVPDPRPRAFIGFAIEGPNDDGFTDASFANITRPHLTVTGVGDTTNEMPPADPAQRRRVFDLEPPGQKYRFWVTDPGARHESFDHQLDACTTFQMRQGRPVALCADVLSWMESAALAFADAQLRERPEALAWLASNQAAILSGAVVEWSRR